MGITSAKRLRWGKDGRLPRSGAAIIRPGRAKISLWTYAPAVVQHLLDQPEIIADWRRPDSQVCGLFHGHW